MKSPLTFIRNLLLVAALPGFMSADANGRFMMPQPTPIERLLTNAASHLAKHPEDAHAHYTLGRIHYLAFHLKSDKIPALSSDPEGKEPPRIAPQWMLGLWGEKQKSGEPAAAQIAEHAAKALKSFKEALRLNPQDDLTQLGIASLKEEFAEWSKSVKGLAVPKELGGITVNEVREDYARAFSLAMVRDSKLEEMPLAGIHGITAHEAATALVRLAKVESEPLTDAGRKNLEEATKALEKFNSLPMRVITPMVFSLDPAARLDDLLAPEVVVDFDLRGYGPRESWPWIKPSLGLLVWDPLRNGTIRSARQLFGGYTFEIFHANGYEALAMLDDDGDGQLTGAEIHGISAWFDRNSDGISSQEEVTPLGELGVESVAVKVESHEGIHPTNARGITLAGGRTLRTWDWIVKPVQNRRQAIPPLRRP